MGRRTEEAVAEGTSIALAAARLAIKNQILVDTIAGDASFDTERFLPAARTVVMGLIVEADEAAERLRKQGRTAWGKHSQSIGTHDYRDRDVKNLRRRRRQSEGVAEHLRGMVEDDAQLRALVDEAREAAWTDVAANLDRRLRAESMRPDEDPDYAVMRGARMQALQLVDLQALQTQMKARAKASKSAAKAAAKSAARAS